MKDRLLFSALSFLLITVLSCGITAAGPVQPLARIIDPIVSTDWLASNSNLENLVILDIRSAEEYKAGHIANAINAPSDVWVAMRGELLLEIPEEKVLFQTIGSFGITETSAVVIVTSVAAPPAPPFSLANATRVADTLVYAGVKNVAILDGGFSKWEAEGKPVTTTIPAITSVAYQGKVNPKIFVPMEYVKENIGKSTIIDARDIDVYFGVTTEPWAQKAGHIPTAKSLPGPWIWNQDGAYKPQNVLKEMAAGVISSPNSEIIVYCGVGGYASSWWYVLTQVLGYENVKFFDGAAQEWVISNEMVKYSWTL
jgi:thiosulfate/3-mercaptopyruvate sulfurtransferase